jgi:hypothetical protein
MRLARRARATGPLAVFGLWLLATVACAQPTLHVRYPAAESAGDARQDYPRAVLAMALEHHGTPHALVQAQLPATQERALRQLTAGEGIDVVWSVATDERDRAFQRVPVAIDRGLIGARVLLVRQVDAPRLAQVRDLPALARLRGAQGHDWPDLQVLRTAGLDVVAAPGYDSLFAMLARGRIDYFPRSVLEVGRELEQHGGQGLLVAPGLLLHYPSGLFFYVRRQDDVLAQVLADGLAAAIRDGCLPRLFDSTHGAGVAALGLSARTRFDLPNPTWSGERESQQW